MKGALQNSCYITPVKSLKNIYKGVQFLIILLAKFRNFIKIELVHVYFLRILSAGTEEQRCRKTFFQNSNFSRILLNGCFKETHVKKPNVLELYMTVWYYYDVTYEFQSESTHYSLPLCQVTPCLK